MNEKYKIKKFLANFLRNFAALVIRSFLYEPFSIPQVNVSNLKVGDYFLYQSFHMVFRNSLPFSIPLIPGRIFIKSPKEVILLFLTQRITELTILRD